MKHRHRARTESDRRYQRRVEMMPLSEPCAECGKYRYFNRKAARRAARRYHPGDSMSVYRCGDFWHIGHTPWDIKASLAQRSNLTNEYTPVGRRRVS